MKKNANTICFETEILLSEQPHVTVPRALHNDMQDHILNFEERVLIFRTLCKHLLLKEATIYLADLYFWFPECQNTTYSTLLPIPRTIIEDGLELFLAELWCNDPNSIWRYF